jgi:hypothetical protein
MRLPKKLWFYVRGTKAWPEAEREDLFYTARTRRACVAAGALPI